MGRGSRCGATWTCPKRWMRPRSTGRGGGGGLAPGRVCLGRPEIFRGQIRAVLRARARANVQLMIPMVTQVEEVLRTREMIAEAIEDLRRGGRAPPAVLPPGGPG